MFSRNFHPVGLPPPTEILHPEVRVQDVVDVPSSHARKLVTPRESPPHNDAEFTSPTRSTGTRTWTRRVILPLRSTETSPDSAGTLIFHSPARHALA